MADYKKMYYELFNAVTRAIETLQQAQRRTEELYISQAEDEPRAFDSKSKDRNSKLIKLP